jgi:hypothetical protein
MCIQSLVRDQLIQVQHIAINVAAEPLAGVATIEPTLKARLRYQDSAPVSKLLSLLRCKSSGCR